MACHFGSDWSPVDAAATSSAIAAVLAGFVFSGIVVILSVKAEGGQGQSASRALKLFLTAFVGLAVTSYLFSDLSGDHICARADTEEVLIGGMLGTFAVIMLASLTWLISAFAPEKDSVLDFLRRLVCLASGMVVLLLAVSSQATLSTDLPYPSPLSGDIVIYVLCGVAIVFLVGDSLDWRIGHHPVVPEHSARLLRAWATMPPDKEDEGVKWCTGAAFAYLAVNALAMGVALGLSPTAWKPEQAPWSVYAAAWWSLLSPLAVLGFAIRALAHSTEVG